MPRIAVSQANVCVLGFLQAPERGRTRDFFFLCHICLVLGMSSLLDNNSGTDLSLLASRCNGNHLAHLVTMDDGGPLKDSPWPEFTAVATTSWNTPLTLLYDLLLGMKCQFDKKKNKENKTLAELHQDNCDFKLGNFPGLILCLRS